jgi:hypothetical protein
METKFSLTELTSALVEECTQSDLPDKHNSGPGIGPCSGWIAFVGKDGEPYVSYQGNRSGPVRARTLVQISREDLEIGGERAVLLLFEGGDPAHPVILGLIHDKLFSPMTMASKLPISPQDSEVFLDGKRIVLDAREEIILRCGKGSIRIHKNGKIVIKGSHLVSRSSGQNRMQGASLALN